MAQLNRDAFEYGMEDDFDYTDFEDENNMLEAYGRDEPSDFDFDEDSDMSRFTDTTADQARNGRDFQGIPWERLQFTREMYRKRRLLQYRNYENLDRPRDELENECMKYNTGGGFYNFQHNTRSVKPTVIHFQLRNLVWATSKHDVYLLYSSSVLHHSPLTCKCTEVLNVTAPLAPAPEQALGRIQICTMCVKDNLLVGGGFQGELVCKFLDRLGVSYCAKISHEENAITNAIEIYKAPSGATRFMSSNNDSIVRIFETERFAVLGQFRFPWAVNHVSLSPDNKYTVVVGDDTDGYLVDSETGKVIKTLEGHFDFSFASAWHPDGQIFATGNQDTSCRLWDIRKLDQSLAVLKGKMGAIRSLRFTSDGKFMAMAEAADFVHIFDVSQGFKQCQEIDLFGEIAGISFSPDTQALFVGVADRTYGSLLEFSRFHANSYLNSII